MNMDVGYLGEHIIIDLFDCNYNQLENIPEIYLILKNSLEIANATIIKSHIKKFKPQGVTILFLLAESHLSFHSYPEKSSCMIDIFTCGKNTTPQKACEYILNNIIHKNSKIIRLTRGSIEK